MGTGKAPERGTEEYYSYWQARHAAEIGAMNARHAEAEAGRADMERRDWLHDFDRCVGRCRSCGVSLRDYRMERGRDRVPCKGVAGG